jgi:hypothetical protein
LTSVQGVSGEIGGGSGDDVAQGDGALVCMSGFTGLSAESFGEFSAFEALKSEKKKTTNYHK